MTSTHRLSLFLSSLLPRDEKPLRHHLGIHRPECPQTRTANPGGTLNWAAAKHGASPLGRDLARSVNGAKQGTSDRPVGVGVATAHHRRAHTLCETLGVQRLIESVLHRDADMPCILLVLRKPVPRLLQRAANGRVVMIPARPVARKLICLPPVQPVLD